MKKILVLLTLAVALFSFTSVMAVDNIELSAGYYYFATKTATPSAGYSLKITIPTGIDMKTFKGISEKLVTQGDKVFIQTDSLYDYTLQWMTEGETVFSDYTVGGTIQEVESKIFSTYVRKSIGFWTTFIDVGGTYWDIPNSLGDNTSYEGYYIGIGAKPWMDFRTKLGTYILNRGAGEPKLFVLGLNVGYKF